jgi:hypothetical protein
LREEPAGKLATAGLVLELLGLVAVAKGLGDTQRFFGRPTIRGRTTAWLGRLPRLFAAPRVVEAQANLTLNAGAFAARGRVTQRLNPESPLEQQVFVLEQRLDDLAEFLDAEIRDARTSVTSLRAHVDDETSVRANLHAELQRKVEAFATGGLALESVGLTWLVAGTLLTALAADLAALV